MAISDGEYVPTIYPLPIDLIKRKKLKHKANSKLILAFILKKPKRFVLVFLVCIVGWLIYSVLAFRAASFSLKCSIADPTIQ